MTNNDRRTYSVWGHGWVVTPNGGKFESFNMYRGKRCSYRFKYWGILIIDIMCKQRGRKLIKLKFGTPDVC